MSRRRTKANDDTEFELTQPQGSQQTQSSQVINDEAIQNAVPKLVRYILQNGLSSKQAIKRQDLTEHVPEIKAIGRHFNSVFKRANEILKNVYGLEAIQLESGSVKQFMVINRMQVEDLLRTPREKSDYALLLIILAHIFMSGGASSEDLIFQLLRKLEIITQDSFVHDRFGDVKTLITVTFIKQLYLSKSTKAALSQTQSTQSTQNGMCLEYIWGPRSEHEISKSNVLLFVSKVFNRGMKTWPTQYKIVQQEQEGRNNLEANVELES